MTYLNKNEIHSNNLKLLILGSAPYSVTVIKLITCFYKDLKHISFIFPSPNLLEATIRVFEVQKIMITKKAQTQSGLFP